MSVKRCPPNCEKRSYSPNCHDTCEIYAEIQKYHASVRENRKREKELNDIPCLRIGNFYR